MSLETAQYLLSLKLPEADRQRFNELAAQSGKGALSAEEQAELDEYRRVGRLMELLQLRARVTLKKSSGS